MINSDINDLSGLREVLAEVVTIGFGAPLLRDIITEVGNLVGWGIAAIEGIPENSCEFIDAKPSWSCFKPLSFL